MTNPVLFYHVSAMACKKLDLSVGQLKQLCSILTQASAATPTLSFTSTNEKGKFILERYFDAALDKRLAELYDGHLGFTIFCRYRDIVHPIYWSASKLRRVACSSATAKIPAAAETADALLYL